MTLARTSLFLLLLMGSASLLPIACGGTDSEATPLPSPPDASSCVDRGTCDDDCEPGSYLDDGACRPWTECSEGTFVSREGSGAADRQCTPCPSGETTTAKNQATCTELENPPTPGATGCTELTRRERAIGERATDEYQWSDGACKTRSAALVRVDRKGGHAIEFSYPLADGTTRVAGISPEMSWTNPSDPVVAGGFGYVVSHLRDPQITNRNGWNDSPLGSPLCADDFDPTHDYATSPCTNGYAHVFEGRHHAIHEFTLNYPRWGRNEGQDVRYDMPVTIHWLFHTGMNAMVYAITFDVSRAPANAIDADLRAPYGSMNFDGTPAGTWGSNVITGVAWGDNKKFETLANGALTMNSPWTWSEANEGPAYHRLWTQDAEMGSVVTQVIGKLDAGGYGHAITGRGETSAAGFACASDPVYGGQAHTMPCAANWSFQSINYAFFDGVGAPVLDSPTVTKRFAWGADWGYLGNAEFTSVNGNVVRGHPRVSYSVFIALDAHAQAPTTKLAAQMQVVDRTTVTASTGRVRTQGPAGVGRSDLETYSPAGYNSVYSTWEIDADANAASLGIDVGQGGALERPTFVIHGYDGTTAPTTVTLDGSALTADTHYFASVNPEARELWLTLNYDLRGAGHRLVVR